MGNSEVVANIAMWFLILLSIAIAILVIVAMRNTVVSERENEQIKKKGNEVVALITHSEHDNIQNVGGCLSLRLTIRFMANGKEINAKKDIIVKNLNAYAYRAGKRVTIRYSTYNPEKIVIS